jgi:hypothetical protein
LAAVALAAGVFVSGAKAAPSLCGSKQCAEEIAAGCAGLSGADFRACKRFVLDQCKISGETFCSCTDPTLPACGPTTTTTTTTTSTTTTSTAFLEFTTGTPGGTCGNTLDGSNVLIKNLTCGGLNIGSSGSIVPEGPISDGSTSRFALSCTGASCTIGPTSTAPPVNTAGPDCTDIGCNFGTPMAIPPPFTALFNYCVLSTWSAPASGTLDLTSGTSSTNVALNFDVYATPTFNGAQPCPRCSATGTPSQPGTGTCDRGPRAGMACTTTSSTGLTRDCPTGGVGTPATPCPVGNGTGSGNCCPTPATCNCPCTPGGGNCCDGAHLRVIPIDLSPLTTGTASATDPGGLFCPGQAQAGCFSGALGESCRTITERGVAAGPIFTGVPADATLASVFCIAATGEAFMDNPFGLPGPGAVSLPGTFLVHN